MISRSRYTIAVPPGETIKEQLATKDLTQKELACRLGFSEKHISKLMNGAVALTPETAVKLEPVLGIPASFWLGLESNYRKDLAIVKDESEMEDDETLVRKCPYAECVKHGWLPDTKDIKERVRALRSYFNVSNLKHLFVPENALMPRIAFRCLGDKESIATAIWVEQAKKRAEKITVEKLDLYRLEQLLPEFREMTKENPAVFYPKLEKMCASCGIALLTLPCLSGTKLHGASFAWKKRVVLALTVRRKYADVFWFSFFHEIGHIIEMHYAQASEDIEKQEKDADLFARNTLIPPDEYHKLSFGPLDSSSIRLFAESVDIAPGIVVGRLQKEGKIGYDELNSLRDKYELKSA